MSLTVLTLPGEIEIESVDAQSLRRDDAFWRLYEDFFPANERDPREVILATVERETGFALRARSGGRTIGMAVAHLLREPATTFLIYLAVHGDWRARRLGAAMLSAVEQVGAGRLRAAGLEPHGMVWEMNDPALATDPEDRNVRDRRRAFFERAGGRQIDVPYVQPPLDGVTPLPMLLMYLAGVYGVPTGAAARDLIRAIYFEKYGAMNGIPTPVLEQLTPKAG
jgi:hypothetical protein